MIECTKFTNFSASKDERQEMFIFAFAVAGKNSRITQAKVNSMLERIYRMDRRHISTIGGDIISEEKLGPLEYLAWMDWDDVLKGLMMPLSQQQMDTNWIRSSEGGLGKYATWKRMLKWFRDLVTPSVDAFLETAELEELERVPGVGFKTSRFFTLHSRQDADCVPLDRHILRFLRDQGHWGAPNVTPGSEDVYLNWEVCAIDELRELGYATLAEADLNTWKQYSGNLI